MRSDATHCGTLSRADITARRAAGESIAAIADAAGSHPVTLWLALRAWGMTTKRGGDRRSPSWRERFNARLGGAA